MKKITLLICLMLCGLFVVGGATASAAGGTVNSFAQISSDILAEV